MSILQTVKREYLKRKPRGYWFTPETMNFFNSKIDENNLFMKKNEYYFITSEKRDFDTERFWSIRKLLSSGCIETIGDFCMYKSVGDAEKAFKILVTQ